MAKNRSVHHLALTVSTTNTADSAKLGHEVYAKYLGGFVLIKQNVNNSRYYGVIPKTFEISTPVARPWGRCIGCPL